jgi:hypothetical protein
MFAATYVPFTESNFLTQELMGNCQKKAKLKDFPFDKEN